MVPTIVPIMVMMGRPTVFIATPAVIVVWGAGAAKLEVVIVVRVVVTTSKERHS